MRIRAAAILALAALAGAALGEPQPPQPPPKPARIYAVVSMVGDRLAVLTRSMHTGTHFDRNDRATIELNDTALNDAVADAIYDALEPRVPDSRVALLTVRDPSLWAAQNRLVEQGASTEELLDALKPALDRMPATYLVLATKMRRDALFEVDGSHVGSGKAEGLGFYVDRQMSISRDGYGEAMRGFLGTFAYFRISLIDLRTRKVIRETAVPASTASVASAGDADHPWDTMSAAQKVSGLKQLIHDEATRAIPALLGSG
jgi:hypothetical protein